MPFLKSRFVPLAFWVGFIALGLATNVSHERKAAGFARDRQEVGVANAAGKRLPLLSLEDRRQSIARD